MKKILLLICCFLFSCRSENKLESQLKYEEYVSNNFINYESIYNKIYSWLEESKKLNCRNTIELIFEPDFKIDQLLIINDEGTKLVGNVNFSQKSELNGKYDWVFTFWGVKIGNRWNFARGGSLYIPRANYKYNIYEPLSHFQLSYIGRDYFLKHFLTINQERISVKSELLNKHVSIIDGLKNKKDSHENWHSFFDEYKQDTLSQKEISETWNRLKIGKEKKALPKKGTKEFKELYGDKVPLFEREEWKTYEANLKKDQN